MNSISQLSSDINMVLDYMYEDEKRDYLDHHGAYDPDKPEDMNQNHIFTRLVRLSNFVEN